MLGRPQRSPTFGPPEQSYLISRKVSENLKVLGRNIFVICPRSCRVAASEIQITSCPSKKEFFTLPISVICTELCHVTEIISEAPFFDFLVF